VGLTAMEYFIICLLLVFFLHSSSRFLEKKNKQNFKNYMNQMVRIVKQEHHGSCYYWFDSENDNFIAQGSSYSELVEQLRERFPRHIFLIGNNKMMAGPKFEVLDINPENLIKLSSE